MRKSVFLVVAILIFTTGLVWAEEIKLTTIIPNQTTLRVKKGVVGENYSDLTKPGAVTDTNIPTSSLLVEGNLGIGTTTPQAKLHVSEGQIFLGSQNDGVFAHNARLKISSDFAGTGIELYSAGYFDNEEYGTRIYKADVGNGIGLQIDTHTYSGGWKWVPSVFIGDGVGPKFPLLGIFGGTVIGKTYTGFFLPPSDGLLVEGNVGIGTTNPNGKLDVNGQIWQRGTLLLHADYVFEPGYKLESIENHAGYMWQNKHLPAVPMAKRDENNQEMVEIGANTKGILEELEKAHIYIQQLNERIKVLEARMKK